MDEIRVVELFAGVGGFRVGLERASGRFTTVWANQWEPGKKKQHAFDCYAARFGEDAHCVNQNIAEVVAQVPEHDLLVGGFPCQDYSVARTGAKGIEGKKGVLWWSIRDIAEARRPRYILLENVDRLIKSPATQRGRDFGIILRSLFDLGYAVEWRVINAADYGQAQRRRRVFIFAYHESTPLYRQLAGATAENKGALPESWLAKDGFFATTFPVSEEWESRKMTSAKIGAGRGGYKDLVAVSNRFSAKLYNTGVMVGGQVLSQERQPQYEKPVTLGEILSDGPVAEKYFLAEDTQKWEYLKGAKREPRTKPNGDPYFYTEGGMCFPDDLDKPSRTMLTSESSVNRSTHVVEDKHQPGRLRLLTPEECEKLNGFDPGWTNTGMPERFRYFTMGNALVVPLITRMGQRVIALEEDPKK